MSLIKALEELKDQPSQILMDANEKEERAEPEVEEKEVKAEPEKEDKEEVSEGKDEKVSGYKERKIKAAEKRELEATERANRLEAQLIEVTKNLSAPKQAEQKPAIRDRAVDPQGWAQDMAVKGQQEQQQIVYDLKQIKFDNAMTSAKSYVASLEKEYSKDHPDYEEAIKYGFDREVAKQKLINPKANESEIRAGLENDKIKLAAHFRSIGVDPIEGMHKMMKDVYGYKPAAKEEDKEETSEADKFDSVKKNKAKSATALTAGGRTSNVQTLGSDSARKITVAQFQKMSPTERDKVFSGKR